MKRTHFTHGTIHVEPKECGPSIEEQIRQAIATNSPIEGKAPMIYTPSKDGVNPAYNVRTDKQDLALLANDKYQASERMKGFMTETEYDQDGYDGNGNKRPSETDTKGD